MASSAPFDYDFKFVRCVRRGLQSSRHVNDVSSVTTMTNRDDRQWQTLTPERLAERISKSIDRAPLVTATSKRWSPSGIDNHAAR